MNVLVTGGAGFIGSHLAETLSRDGHSVRVLDNFATGKRENLADVGAEVELIEGDVRDLDTCRRACKDVSRVWHLAALGSVPRSVSDPLTTHDANLTGTLNMLLAARDAGVQRFVFASSSSVYGANPLLPREETQHPMPISPYANSKLAAETYVRMFAGLYDLETVALRYFNVYGPRQDPTSQYAAVVPKFLAALTSQTSPVIYGDGEQSREFTYVADCVQGNILAGTVEGDGIAGEHFNVAAGHPATVNRLLAAVQSALGTSIEADYQPERPGDVRYSDAIVAKASTRLGFRPRWKLEDGISETAKWFRAWSGGASQKVAGQR
jgi:nucleoside-diphosphate-sugar epimerase